jgi:hypothetical protein
MVTIHCYRGGIMKFEKQITRFVLITTLVAVIVVFGAIAAFAGGTYVLGTGTGSSQDVGEAVATAVANATSDMYSKCNGQITGTVQVTHSVNSSGTGNMRWYYVDASANGYCEER